MDQWCQIFKVHLVDDTCSGGNYPQVIESSLSPVQQFISFLVAVEFIFFITMYGIRSSIVIHLYGMVYDQITGTTD
jgi:hypothetical protein